VVTGGLACVAGAAAIGKLWPQLTRWTMEDAEEPSTAAG
jgi:hypothetical protein